MAYFPTQRVCLYTLQCRFRWRRDESSLVERVIWFFLARSDQPLLSLTDVPQTEEARTEAFQLMNIKRNLVTPRNGEPIIAATQDFITGCFLITRRDTFFTRSEITQMCAYLQDAELEIDLPCPTILKPERLWTGKQVFNVLMRPSKSSPVNVNLECKNKTSEKPSTEHDLAYPAFMSRNDGYLVVQNSEIICGVFDKSTVGDGNKKSVFAVIQRDFGEDAAAKCMNRMAKLCARWLGKRLFFLSQSCMVAHLLIHSRIIANKGFSIGISDVTPGAQLRKEKDSLVRKAYDAADEYIRLASENRLECQPGSNMEQTLESMISGDLSRVRDQVGEICMTELSRNNSPLIMATCGSKGTFLSFLLYLNRRGWTKLSLFSRFEDQRFANGCLCRSTNYRR